LGTLGTKRRTWVLPGGAHVAGCQLVIAGLASPAVAVSLR
jgi:hypothetical protein